MDILKEMADIAIKEFGGMGLIVLSISILSWVYLIFLFWKRWKSISHETDLTEEENLRTAEAVGNGLMGIQGQNGLDGSPQIEIGPVDAGLEVGGVDGFFEGFSELFSIFS
jgi:hypothetical protein